MLSLPPPTRIALGTVEIAGKQYEIIASTEWARYFQSLNTQVQSSSTLIIQGAGLVGMLSEAPEVSDAMPAPPGPPGQQGAPGMALFMLQDDSGEQQMLTPPPADLAAPPAIGTAAPAAGTFTALKATGAFGCNGKTPQTGAASGGTLAGVIAALVANGILTS